LKAVARLHPRTAKLKEIDMADTNGHNSPDRLDRLERIVEVLANTQIDIQQDVKILIRGQVVMGEALTKLAEAQKHTDQRMDALILTVDEIIRGRKRE
jgi:exonuclease VII small subunit